MSKSTRWGMFLEWLENQPETREGRGGDEQENGVSIRELKRLADVWSDGEVDNIDWKSKFIQQNKDLCCENMDPNGTIWDHAKRLQAENERLREALKDIIHHAKYAHCGMITNIAEKALERKQP